MLNKKNDKRTSDLLEVSVNDDMNDNEDDKVNNSETEHLLLLALRL